MNFGSGNQLLGGDANNALNEAIARRQTGGAGATQQVSPAAATFDPTTQTPSLQAGGAPQMPGQAGAAGASMPQPATPFESPEAKMIVGGVLSRLKALSQLQGAR